MKLIRAGNANIQNWNKTNAQQDKEIQETMGKERSGIDKINQEPKLNKSSTDNSIMFSVLTISVSYIGIPAFGS